MAAVMDSARNDCQALAFLLDGGKYAVDILQVQEIRGSDRPTAIPSAPDFFKGVTNLRGTYVPVIDLRLRLGMPIGEASREGVTIILRLGESRVGIVVDAVCDVVSMANLKPPPAMEFAPAAACVRGLVSENNETVVVLDIEHVLASTEAMIREFMAARSGMAAI